MDSGLVLYVNLSDFLHMNDPMDITCMPNFRNGLIGVCGGGGGQNDECIEWGLDGGGGGPDFTCRF